MGPIERFLCSDIIAIEKQAELFISTLLQLGIDKINIAFFFHFMSAVTLRFIGL